MHLLARSLAAHCNCRYGTAAVHGHAPPGVFEYSNIDVGQWLIVRKRLADLQSRGLIVGSPLKVERENKACAFQAK